MSAGAENQGYNATLISVSMWSALEDARTKSGLGKGREKLCGAFMFLRCGGGFITETAKETPVSPKFHATAEADGGRSLRSTAAAGQIQAGLFSGFSKMGYEFEAHLCQP